MNNLVEHKHLKQMSGPSEAAQSEETLTALSGEWCSLDSRLSECLQRLFCDGMGSVFSVLLCCASLCFLSLPSLAQSSPDSLQVESSNEQSLIYDLTVNGQIVGQRRIKIQYLPASSKLPYGSRIVESWTSVDLKIPVTGKQLSYTQRATGHFSNRGSKFVSVVDAAGEGFEFQGNQRQGGVWSIYEQQGQELSQRAYSASEMQSFSLALFDPGQLEQWMSGANRNIYHIEMGELWTGQWTELPSQSISIGNVTIEGIAMHFQSPEGELDALWSDTGLLLDWTLRVNGIELDANLRSLPAPPQFGNIAPIIQFDGVEEESL